MDFDILSKLTRTRVLHCEMELILLTNLHKLRREKIERSAEALRVRHTRQIFPSKDDFANNTREQSQGQKAKGGKKT